MAAIWLAEIRSCPQFSSRPVLPQAASLGLDLLRVNNLDTGIPGKSGLVESENSAEVMYLHGCDQASVVGGLAHDLMLDDEGFPRPDRLPASPAGKETYL
jgi:hypothetical protein